VSVIDTRNNVHWTESNWQFIWAAHNFVRKTNAAVPLECGKQGTVLYENGRSVGRRNLTSLCEWNTKFSTILEIPTNRVHSKQVFTIPFNFVPEISEFLVKRKAAKSPGGTGQREGTPQMHFKAVVLLFGKRGTHKQQHKWNTAKSVMRPAVSSWGDTQT